MLTATAGNAIMAHRFSEYKAWKGLIPGRLNGVLIAKEAGTATPYSIDKLQDRGRFFIDAGVEVYGGQILGENSRADDLVINVCEAKKLTNHRSSGADDSTRIAPKIDFSLEEYMEYIGEDERIEVTPENIRLRKVHLDHNVRKRAKKQMQA